MSNRRSGTPSVRLERFRGQAAVVLSDEGGHGSRMEAVFLPSMGMLGASLTVGGEHYVSLHGGVSAFADGHTTGVPLLHPWANRLGAAAYRAAGVRVPTQRAAGIHRDENGRPIHGTMVGPRHWTIDRIDAGPKAATLRASFDFGAHADLLQSFPFPHVIDVQARVKGHSLTVTTTVRPSGKQAVPISFGWHPYFRMPSVRRPDVTLVLPKRRHLPADVRGIPTGKSTRQPAERAPIAGRTFDDGYRLGQRDRWLGLEGGGRCLTIEFDDGYPYTQVYIPAGKPFVALEPMTAPTNALVSGDHVVVKPGDAYSATFTVRIGPTDAAGGAT